MDDMSMNLVPLDEFAVVLSQLAEVVHALAEIEEQKADAAANSQHHLINDFLNPEQALVLKLRGLEQKRIRLADNLGWQGLAFRQILELADDRQSLVLNPLFIDLNTQVKRLTEAKDASEKMIRLRLRELETAFAGEGGQSYGNNDKNSGRTLVHFQDQYV